MLSKALRAAGRRPLLCHRLARPQLAPSRAMSASPSGPAPPIPAPPPAEPPVELPVELPEVYVPTYAGDSWYGPFDGMEMLLEYMHANSGLGWCEVIVLTTFGFRLMMTPVMIGVLRNSQRIQRIQGQVQALTDKIKAASTTDPMLQKQYAAEINKLFETNDCHPLRSLRGIAIQAPVFMSFFFAIRRIAAADPSFAHTGMPEPLSWVTDLSMPDPYYVLPVATSLTMMLTIQLGADGQQVQNNPQMKYIMMGFGGLLIPVTSYMESGLFCYWLTSNCYSLAQVGVLRIPAVRNFFDLLPPPPVEPAPGTAPIRYIDDEKPEEGAEGDEPAKPQFKRKKKK